MNDLALGLLTDVVERHGGLEEHQALDFIESELKRYRERLVLDEQTIETLQAKVAELEERIRLYVESVEAPQGEGWPKAYDNLKTGWKR